VTWQWLPVEREKGLNPQALLSKVSQPLSSVMTEGTSRKKDKRVWRGEGSSPESDT